MKNILMSNEMFEHLGNVSLVRQASGIEPAVVNGEMAKFQQYYQNLRDAKKQLAEHLKFGVGSNPAEEFERAYRNELGKFQDKMAIRLIHTYQFACMPNAELNVNRIMATMRAGRGELFFDADVIEDEVAKLYAQRRELSFTRILLDAKWLRPYDCEECRTKEEKIQRMIVGRKLWLRLVLGVDVHNKLVEIRLPYDKRLRIQSLDKLSQVLILDRDPATVESHICDTMPASYTPGPYLSKEFQGTEPIETLAFQSGGKFIVTYKTRQQARRVAEVLATDQGG